MLKYQPRRRTLNSRKQIFSRLNGIEVIEQEHDFCIIKDISEGTIAEFDNIINAGATLVSPLGAGLDLNGYTLTLDAGGTTSLRGNPDNQINIAIAGVDTFQLTSSGMTILGNRVLTSADRTELITESQKAANLAKMAMSWASDAGFLMTQLNNF